jgi:hypothetical protein
LAFPAKEPPMNEGKTVFSQIMEFLPMYEFRKCVERYHGDYKVLSFSCLDQFLCMAFAQMTFRESLRDIQACLRSKINKLYHMGIRGQVSRNTLSNANNQRDWRIYADLAMILIHRARKLYINEPFGIDLNNTVYALDSTTIDLCLALFPWARFRKNKGAVKLHTLLDLRGNIPSFIDITDGKVHDVNVLDILIFEAGSFYIMDRGYIDFKRLYALHQALAFFVTRAKSNLKCRRLYSRPVDKTTGLRCDQTIVLTQSFEDYPEQLRRVKFYDAENDLYLTFLTNNFTLDALTIAKLYKCRWQVELFFKWIKQHLRIKAFFGTSENAVKTQVWIAVSIYVLIAIIRKQLSLEPSLYTILQILSVNIFEKEPISRLLTTKELDNDNSENDNQLKLF